MFRLQKVFFLLVVTILISAPLGLKAQDPNLEEPRFKIPDISFKIVNFSNVEQDNNSETCPEITEGLAFACLHIPWIGEYIASIYVLAVSSAGILAAVVLMIAGYIWLTAGGNANQIGTAQKYASGAVVGFVLMLGSYVVLYTINPKLVTFNALHIPIVKKIDLDQVKKLNAAGNCRWTEPEDSAMAKARPLDATYNELNSECPFGTIPGSTCKKEDQQNKLHICCCQKINYNTAAQPGVMEQKKDASSALASLISCLQGYYPVTLNSISDDNIAKGTCQPWDPNEQFSQPESTGNCQHAQYSTHYGGRNHPIKSKNDSGFSYGVDINEVDSTGKPIPYDDIYEKATKLCGAGYGKNEGDHYHFSVSGSGSD